MKKILLIAFLFVALYSNAQKKLILETPPMGWNSWNYFACDVSEVLIKEMADAMVSSGMAAVGYEYIVIDDCWQVARDENNVLVADSVRFPNGIKALADYVHSKGLKFGIYSDAGTKTCQERPGSLGFEVLDAKTFEAWGVDYLKYDWCYHGSNRAENIYPIMGKALYELERPIVFSVCNWGWGKPWEWASEYAHLWRTSLDIEARFDGTGNIISRSVEQVVDRQIGLESYAQINAWNDPDMLEVGNGLSHDENVSHFSLWAILTAPLMSGNDLRNMDEETKSVLLNKEVIAINQDALGKQGSRILKNKDYEIWLKPLANGNKAVCVFNRNNTTKEISLNLKDVLNLTENYKLRNVWLKEDLGTSNQDLKFSLNKNASVLLVLSL